jgi:hypothetical protein
LKPAGLKLHLPVIGEPQAKPVGVKTNRYRNGSDENCRTAAKYLGLIHVEEKLAPIHPMAELIDAKSA